MRSFMHRLMIHKHSVVMALAAIPLLLLAWLSYPMMYPGFDVWIHLSRMEYGGQYWRLWYEIWIAIFQHADIQGFFDRALWIHRVQVLLTVGMVGLSAYWILLAIFIRSSISKPSLVIHALCAIWIWLIMHGTASTPFGGDQPFVQSWLMWYSVNYQITLPVFFLSAGALMLSMADDLKPRQRLALTAVSLGGALFIAKIHPSELPYLFWVLGLSLLILVRWRLKHHVMGWALAVSLLLFAFHFSGKLPAGVLVYQQQGWLGLYEAILKNGEWITSVGNRGQASFNYLYSLGLAAVVLSLIAASRLPSVNRRMLWVVLLSAVPVFAIFFKVPAGLLSMVTEAHIVWRFTFSSLLFLGLPILLCTLSLVFKDMAQPVTQAAMSGGVVLLVLCLSFVFEPKQITYQYARSLVQAFEPSKVHYGLPEGSKAWLENTRDALATKPKGQWICADLFSAYYLHFIYDQRSLLLPPPFELSPMACGFPRDGGELKPFMASPLPWAYGPSAR